MSGIIIVTSISFFFGVLIIIVDTLFYRKRDRLKEKILKMLPGYNCGACGYGSCEGMAEIILKDTDAVDKCRPMKSEEKDELKSSLKT